MSRKKRDPESEAIHRLANDDIFISGVARAMSMAQTYLEMADTRVAEDRKTRKPPKRTAPEMMF